MGKAIKQENNLVTFLQFHLGDSAFRKSEIGGFLRMDASTAPAEHRSASVSAVRLCSKGAGLTMVIQSGAGSQDSG